MDRVVSQREWINYYNQVASIRWPVEWERTVRSSPRKRRAEQKELRDLAIYAAAVHEAAHAVAAYVLGLGYDWVSIELNPGRRSAGQTKIPVSGLVTRADVVVALAGGVADAGLIGAGVGAPDDIYGDRGDQRRASDYVVTLTCPPTDPETDAEIDTWEANEKRLLSELSAETRHLVYHFQGAIKLVANSLVKERILRGTYLGALLDKACR